ncbi:GRIP1-associated protein 1-like [Biomphalaria glabrata]|uniref:GRIP1-associated protein 1-like n=1 Tax=Biomphalaria glabrata TaxID=6526 RepID=A0A9W3A4X1_BIOGL|nr:GRIP1-associated protein 1-like [Biomphalaria glabrata]
MAASPSLSDVEFHRMQLQLIELRTNNYEVERRNKLLERELSETKEKIDQLDRELGKAKQAINKSKKAKDVEILLQESDSLQRKLLSQEEEFRLQNQTLMAELSMLVSSNEEYKKKVELLESGNAVPVAVQESSVSEELYRLKAENLALQKNLHALQEKFEKEAVLKSNDQSPEVTIASQSLMQPEEKDSVNGEEAVDGAVQKGLTQSSSEYNETINKLRLELDTEREEKLLIKSELEIKKKEHQEKMTAIQEELEKAADKLRKKQESYLQLHAEKEQVFKEMSAKLDENQAARDRDQKYYKDQIAKLQAEIEKVKKESEYLQSNKDKQIEELKHHLSQLQTQVDASGIVASHQLQEQSGKYLAEITVLRDQLSRITKERDDLVTQLQESRRVADDAVSQMQAALSERDKNILSMQEISKVAEKRKSLVDEMAIKYQKEYDAHRENVARIEEKQAAEVEKLQAKIEEQSKKILELSKQAGLVEEKIKKIASLEDTKGWLERRLTEVEAQLESTVKTFNEEKLSITAQYSAQINDLLAQQKEELKHEVDEKEKAAEEWKNLELKLNSELEAKNDQIQQLLQEIKDMEEEKKLHEKKGITMLKDLKRQLHAERKRGEKLQAKLQEVLSEETNKHVEDLFRTPDSELLETSSLSSWGAAASGLGKDSVASGPQSPTSGVNSQDSDAGAKDEFNDLFKRIGQLQQDKWALEEKVSHLETSNACMAEDLLNKTSIIEHYVMNSRAGPKHSNSHEDKLTLKKVMDMVNKNSEHTQQTQDMNKKLQSMLEETLTKNMHLQKDLEFMSQEVVRLSKLSISASPEPAKLANTPPATMALPSPVTPEPSTLVSAERESSVTSDENFEIISGPQDNDSDIDGKLVIDCDMSIS